MSDTITLKEARKLIDNSNYAEAEKCCRDILCKDEKNYIAWTLLGKSLQDFDQAPLAYQEATACKPSQLLAWQSLASYYEQKDVSLKAKVFPIYEEMLKLEMEEEKVVKILTKIGDLGCQLKSSDAISTLVKFINKHQGNLKIVAETHLIVLLKSDVPCKFDDLTMVIETLHNIDAANSSDTVLILICKVILQQDDLKSAVKEITELDFFSKYVTIKQWLCRYLCEYFLNKTSFNGLDVNKYLEIMSIGIESSKYLGLLKSMIAFDGGSYLEAYNQCIPLVDVQEADSMVDVYILKCTVMLKKWSVTKKLGTHFLRKVKDPKSKITMLKLLFKSYFEQHNWSEAISIAKEISFDLLDKDELAALGKCYIEANASAELVLDTLDGNQYRLIKSADLIKQGKYEEAINVLQKCKEHSLKYFYLGKAYWYLKQYEICLENFLKSTEVNWGHPDTFYTLGLFYDQYKIDLQKSRQCYKKAHSLGDFDGYYVQDLGEDYVRLGLDDHAFEMLVQPNENVQNKERWLNIQSELDYP